MAELRTHPINASLDGNTGSVNGSIVRKNEGDAVVSCELAAIIRMLAVIAVDDFLTEQTSVPAAGREVK